VEPARREAVLVLGGDTGNIVNEQGGPGIDGPGVFGAVEELTSRLEGLGFSARRIHPLQLGSNPHTADSLLRRFDHLVPGGMQSEAVRLDVALCDGADSVLIVLPASASAWCALGMAWEAARLLRRKAFRLAIYIPSFDPMIGFACPRLIACAALITSDLQRVIAWLQRRPPALPYANQN
jgi:hypothetical protein